HLRRSRGLVQTVHVLGAQQEVAGQRSLEFRQGKMRRVRLGPGSGPAAIRVVVPDQLRVALPRLDVRQLVMAVPTPARPLEHRNPALRADSGSGQDKYSIALLHTNVTLFHF